MQDDLFEDGRPTGGLPSVELRDRPDLGERFWTVVTLGLLSAAGVGAIVVIGFLIWWL